MIKNKNGIFVDSPVHIWFGLSYSNYFTIPRMALEAMPLDWQERFVELMEQAEATGIETPGYHVLRDEEEYTSVVNRDPEDENSSPYEFTKLKDDPWACYRHPDKSLLKS